MSGPGFWSNLFGGSSASLDSLIPEYANIGGQATGQGFSDINAGTGFMKAILSGDSSKINQALAPEISAAKTSAAQTNKTNAEFGTRSGGTAASTAASSDKTHGDIVNLIGSLTGNAANSLTSAGSSLLNTGLNAYQMQQQASQEQIANWSKSILSKAITGGVSAAESAGIGAIGAPDASAGGGGTGSFGGLTPGSTGGYAETSDFAPTGFFNASGAYV